MPYASNNERLEFIGDAYVDAAVGAELFMIMDNAPEGVLSKNRADVVREESLADAARGIGLGDYIYMGKGEEATGGRNKDSILADCFEALIGAIIIDGGYDAGKRVALELLEEKISLAVAGKLRSDYKTMLQEKIQEKNHDVRIRYSTVSESGPDHNKTFTVEVVAGSSVIGRGTGKSKAKAEQEAAKDALSKGVK
jgi:ribonuclease-3